ncbi:MAG: hypothetical protein Ta2G_12550 [Termitinemataceae bacterium]|nr:MAG: hypothetical protein Ta2G_12550 [Termitinemataceae bacterium]
MSLKKAMKAVCPPVLWWMVKKIKNIVLPLAPPPPQQHQDYGEVVKHAFAKIDFPVDISLDEQKIVQSVRDAALTMTDNNRLLTTTFACKYVEQNNIDGDFVECGVWRGGNSILAASLFKAHQAKRSVYLFDTFTGMTEAHPWETVFFSGEKCGKGKCPWVPASLDDVKNSFKEWGLLNDKVVFIAGDICETLDKNDLPAKISVLRLDTDFYDSTKKEMEVLYPRLSIGGVLILDDLVHIQVLKRQLMNILILTVTGRFYL